MQFNFRTTPDIRFGHGMITTIGEAVSGFCSRPILLTDKGLVGAGLAAPAIASLQAARLDLLVFDDVAADPPAAKVQEALAAAKAHGADGVIGFGGGSSMDTAKLVAVLLKSDQMLADILGTDQVKGGRVPLILCPTTAGTGSEVTSISIVTTDADEKVAVVDDALYPDCALLDPDVTIGLPRLVTAATGIDAMVHAIEAYTNQHKKNPVSDALAREALRLLAGSLVTCCEDPGNKTARAEMLLGAMLAGQAFANSPVGAVHGLAYPLGGIYHIPHGLSNALMLEPVLKFNASKAETLYAELGSVIMPGLSGSTAQRCAAFIERIVDIMSASGCPRRLRDVEIPHSALPKLAEDAMKAQRVLQNNPREVTLADALDLYTQCY